MISQELIAPMLFAGLVIVMVIGHPVAFSPAALGLGFGLVAVVVAVAASMFPPQFLGSLPLRVFGILSHDLLLAIPFLTVMGTIPERCGLAEDLLERIGQLFGPVPGGLAFAVISVGAILGAITGTVAASVITMGMIALSIMMRYGYGMKPATGVVAASGTNMQRIPPSLVPVVLADPFGKSVGDTYNGAIGPSFVQTLLFLAYIPGAAIFRPKWVPPIPKEARQPLGWRLVSKVLMGMIPSIVLICLVLGTIFMGIATPTEAGAMGRWAAW